MVEIVDQHDHDADDRVCAKYLQAQPSCHKNTQREAAAAENGLVYDSLGFVFMFEKCLVQLINVKNKKLNTFYGR